MFNLFNERPGFRLARLELFNWGTFDRQIWIMTPQGQTAVLTGSNGSGKSTIVDALLTLLVEGRQRNYNLASGAGNSRERTERTYVLGQYSRSRGESTIEAKANTLRGTDSHSVILAVFEDAALAKTVSLAQVLWISNVDRVEKRHYVAPFDLTIEQHFPQRHVSVRDLPSGAQVFNMFKDYIAAARKALGLSGHLKALDLFNQTVAVKDIASLNTFVRDHMLDKGNPEDRVDLLRSQYRDLNAAHEAIQRAEHQLHILDPLVAAGREYRQYAQRIERYEVAAALVPLYVADRSRSVLAEALSSEEQLRLTEQSRLESVDSELEHLQRDLRGVEIAIAQDTAGQRVREIEGVLPALKRQIEVLKHAASEYDNNARVLGFPLYHDEEAFHDNRAHAAALLPETADAIQTLDVQRSSLQIRQRDLGKRQEALKMEIDYLRDHLSNIPAQVARIREDICKALGATVDDLPFAGELLRVRDDEARWEGALERLLHSFAQELIVPDELYHPVSRYVNDHHLGGRLVFRRVNLPHSPEGHSPYLEQSGAAPLAYEKLDIKPQTPYSDWLAARLIQQFSYVCCESVAEFRQAERAITPQGQIKHNASRHEKDDRRELGDRRYYVLGWDNRAKLYKLEEEQEQLFRTLREVREHLAHTEHELERKRHDQTTLENLLKVETFAVIDWLTPQAEYDRLVRQLDELRQQSRRLDHLEQQRQALQRQIREAQQRRDAVNRAITTIENQIASYQEMMTDIEQRLAAINDYERWQWEQAQDVLEEIDRERDPLTVQNLHRRANEMEAFIQRSMANFKGMQNRHEAVILDAMNNFRREYPEEGVSLTADIAALDAYETIYHHLESDDLPRHKDRFKQMLNRTVSQGVMAFSSSLTEQEREIKRSINDLNNSLAKVDYGGGSIIQLVAESTSDPEINDFKRELTACIPNLGDNSPEELERAYKRIAALIGRFDDDPGWTRRVIDVRRWYEFAAAQIAGDRQVDYYNDSSGKSGGQKAKLAYTILASAIAYQYGLQDTISGGRSFRLVVIDEAFSKLDDDNARYAMQLFEQLGLQLLVVTPTQQVHVIESYVNAYHVVVNNDEGNDSQLYNLTQAEYRERQREFQTQRPTG